MDESSSSSSSSCSSSSEEEREFLGSISSLFTRKSNDSNNGRVPLRRRGVRADDNEQHNDTPHFLHSPQRKRRRTNTNSSLWSTLSTAALVSAFFMWFYIVFLSSSSSPYDPHSSIRNRTHARTQHRQTKTWSKTVMHEFKKWQSSITPQNKKRGGTEDLPPGCEPLSWHAFHYPTCNTIHEVSLKQMEHHYLASGLWRSVWSVDETSVIKIMQKEHDVTSRNFDRHRRDALVMERYTGSPYVVNIYGYCGNTVVSERLAQGLDELVYNNEEEKGDKSAFWQKKEALATIDLRQRMLWARDVARGMALLHQDHIVHADIQAKQFLVDRETGVVKINDFNRCRFVAMKNETETCPFRIPTAPGKQRSPEEYNQEWLSEKLDIYSLANVLSSLWTSNKPWDDYGAAEAKRMMVRGFIPPSPFGPRATELQQQLWALTQATYAREPAERPTAQDVVDSLDHMLQQEELFP